MATKAKATTKKVKAVKDTVVLGEGDLQNLAHAGTKEAIAKLQKYIEKEQDDERRAYAQMALEECEFFYYEPKNEKEEEEFVLCELIRRREQGIDDLLEEAGSIQVKLDKMKLEKKIHDKVLAKNKGKQEAWKYNFIADLLLLDESVLDQIEDNISYEEAWISEAKKMITTARYKTMPAHHLENFSFDFDDDEIDEEDLEELNKIDENGIYDYDDCDCDGDCGDDCDCEDGCNS